MSAIGLRLRLLWLGAVVATCSLFTAFGGSASATLRLGTSTPTTIDSDSHWFQGNPRPVTHGGYQYFAYWDAPDRTDGNTYLQLTRRRLSDGNRVTIRFDGTGGTTAYNLTAHKDPHNYVGLGISPNDGRLHISWSLHTSDRRHRYLQSAANCMTQTQANFTPANCSFAFAWRQDPLEGGEEEMTYPTYFNDNDGGLYFSWRYDASERGDQFLNGYDHRTGTWTSRGRIMRGRNPTSDRSLEYTFDPDHTGPDRSTYTSVDRGIYLNEWEFDKKNRLHAAWVWREDNGAQHGVHYVYSDDYGATWYGRSRRIATASSDPITIVDLTETQVLAIPPGYQLGASGLEVDSDNNPHVVWGASETPSLDGWAGSDYYAHHIWRTTAGVWDWDYVDTQAQARSGGAMLGDLMFDRANNAYFIFGRRHLGWVPYNRNIWAAADLPLQNLTWQSDGAGGGYMDIQMYSSLTCVDTDDLVNVAATGNSDIRVTMRNDSAATDVEIAWTTTTDTTWDAVKHQRFSRTMVRDRSYVTRTFRITDSDWRNTLRQLEICFFGASSGSQSIDSIDIYNPTTRTVAKTWDFDRSAILYAAEASQADNWSTWNLEQLTTDPVTHWEGYFFVDWQRYLDDRVVAFNAVEQGAPGTEVLTLHEFDITGDDILKDWRFDTDTIGWTAASDVSSYRWADDRVAKGITGTITGSNPSLVSMTDLEIPIAGDGDYLHIDIKNTSNARRAAFWFQTEADRTWTAGKSIQFAITANSTYTSYSIDMSRVSGWDRSTLYQLAIDPADDGTNRGSFAIDRIWIDDTR